jgi:phosphatidylinositol alpha-1,6-mannosyltransferase
VNGKDQQAVATSIATLLNDQENAREMGRKGREWVVEQWRWEIWSEKFRELLKPTP